MLPVHPAQLLNGIKATQVKRTMEVLWDCEYPACPVLEPEYVGLSYGQVAIKKQITMAAQGNSEAFERVLDRIIGKPMQVNQNLNVNKSYKDFLDELAAQDVIEVKAEETLQ